MLLPGCFIEGGNRAAAKLCNFMTHLVGMWAGRRGPKAAATAE